MQLKSSSGVTKLIAGRLGWVIPALVCHSLRWVEDLTDFIGPETCS
jgi:hypothetical protein